MRSKSPISQQAQALAKVQNKIVECQRCPRLRKHCLKIAQQKRKQFQQDPYWGLPVPSFGDPEAALLILGLAPAAHGANRTGRMFTGDQSGLWLYRALHRAGFANQAQSISKGDGLVLQNAYISASVHCAPPDNRPTPEEFENCSEYLSDELSAFQSAQVYLVLGQLALKSLWRLLHSDAKPQKAIPRFAHGLCVSLLDGRTIVCSYHPSQQNTFTGRLTEPMFDRVFELAKQSMIEA